MKEYKIRIYRDNFNRDRWQTFTISYKESDLCIGIDTASYYNPPFQNYNDFSGYFKVFP